MKIVIIILAIVFLLGLILGIEVFLAQRGPQVPFTNPSRAPVAFGSSGDKLTYVVMGDSTAAGQGADYARGIAVGTAEYLAQNRQVKLINLGISGARMKDVRDEQLPVARATKPDVVLISASANDVVRLTRIADVEQALRTIIQELRTANPNVRIVITGSPQMGSIPRFLQPLRSLVGWRTSQMNRMSKRLAHETKVIHVPLAEVTGPVFSRDPNLFASDRFHPNNDGYGIWIPVLTAGLDKTR